MSDLAEEGSRRKRRFSEEFKRDAVRLIVETGYTFKSAAAAFRDAVNRRFPTELQLDQSTLKETLTPALSQKERKIVKSPPARRIQLRPTAARA